MNWRLIPPGILAVLVITKLVYPPFLQQSPFGQTPVVRHVSWWIVLFLVVLYVSAWCWTPGFTRAVQRTCMWFAKWYILPPVLALVIVAGFAWLAAYAWNHTIHEALAQTPYLDLVGGLNWLLDRLFVGAS